MCGDVWSANESDQWRARIFKVMEHIRQGDVRTVSRMVTAWTRTRPKGSAFALARMFEQVKDPEVFERIMDMMRDPVVTDDVKLVFLLSLLRHRGTRPSSDLIECFRDLRHPLQTLTTWLLEGISEDPAQISGVARHLARWDEAWRRQWLALLGESGDARALPLLAIVAEHPDRELARAAIAALARIRSERALAVVETLVNHRQTLQWEIASAQRKLRRAGLTPRPLLFHPGPVWECLLTPPDGHGSQMLLIARHRGEEACDVAFFTLNEQTGITSCHGQHALPVSRYREVIAQIGQYWLLTRTDYEYARALVCDALFRAQTEGAFISPDFALWRWIFNDDALTPAEHRPHFPEFARHEIRRRQRDLLATSDRLLAGPPFSDWIEIETPAARAFLRRWGVPSARSSEAMIAAFLTEVLAPERERFIRRLARTAEFLHQWAQNSVSPAHTDFGPSWCTTLALWIALTEGRRSLRHIPFFVELARRALEHLARHPGDDAFGRSSP